jgi:hypothetical protein
MELLLKQSSRNFQRTPGSLTRPSLVGNRGVATVGYAAAGLTNVPPLLPSDEGFGRSALEHLQVLDVVISGGSQRYLHVLELLWIVERSHWIT